MCHNAPLISFCLPKKWRTQKTQCRLSSMSRTLLPSQAKQEGWPLMTSASSVLLWATSVLVLPAKAARSLKNRCSTKWPLKVSMPSAQLWQATLIMICLQLIKTHSAIWAPQLTICTNILLHLTKLSLKQLRTHKGYFLGLE